MFAAPAPFIGDRTKVKQVNPDLFLDQGSGNFFTGSFDAATNLGKDQSAAEQTLKGGQTDTPTGPFPNPTAPPSTPPKTAAPGGLPPIKIDNGPIIQQFNPIAAPHTAATTSPPPVSIDPSLTHGPTADAPVTTSTPAAARVAPTPSPTPTPPRFNTTPFWQDPFNPPSIGEQGWNDWIRANPTFMQSGAAQINRQLTQFVTSFAASHPGANPSVVNDPAYWVTQMLSTHTNGQFDFPYWESRMMEPEGGSRGPGTTTTSNPNAPMNYTQALAYVNGQVGGAPLSQAEIDAAFRRFGGDRNSTFVTSGLAPVVAFIRAQRGATGGGGGNPPPTPPPGPGPNGPPNPAPFAGPTVTVGGDPLSQLADGSLFNLLLNGGRLRSNIGQQGENALSQMLGGGNLNKRLESIREKMGLLSRSQMNDARGDLASRGLLSEGSTAQGPEMSTLGRINTTIGQQSSTAARDAIVADDQNLLGAIQTATGLDESAANRILSATTNVTDRQQMLGDLAIKSLDQNISWNKFLAEFGLKRDQVMFDIQNNQAATLLPLINAFLGWLNGTTSGFV